MKIAVLGGGMGGLRAAWELSSAGHEVHVYQRGWRLGGKGASGRNASIGYRIEEHGLHVLMGFYDYSLSFLKGVYDEAITVGYPHGTPMPFANALTEWDTAIFSRERSPKAWSFFPATFPPKPGNPWDPPRAQPDYIALIVEAGNVLQQLHAQLTGVLPKLALDLIDQIVKSILALGGALKKAATKALLLTVEAAIVLIGKSVGMLTTEGEEWLFIAVCFLLGNLRSMLDDDLVDANPDFDSINGHDYRNWFGKRLETLGVPVWAATKSPFVTALYDLAFSRPVTLAAGVTLNVILRLALDYRGHLAWKMNAGMGDIVFAPLYIALQARANVHFHFFHRVTALGLDAGKTKVETITLEEQVTTANYQPLIDVGGLACWPNQADATQLPVKYQTDLAGNLGLPPYDFEHGPLPSTYAAGTTTLHRGSDFDVVVLAISVGAFPQVCPALMQAGSDFKKMADGLTTMRTRALQVWLGVPLPALKSPAAVGMVVSYTEPFNSWADMSQVLPQEKQGFVPVYNLAYFCDALADGLVSDANAAAYVAGNADAFLKGDVAQLWPGFTYASHVVDSLPRANVDKSDRYVLSEAGTIRHRLAPGASGYTNLALAGDWVVTSINAGCLEGATLGGMGAAVAITSGTVKP